MGWWHELLIFCVKLIILFNVVVNKRYHARINSGHTHIA